MKIWYLPIKAVLTLSADYTLQEIELKQILSHSLIMRNISGLGLKKCYSPFTLSFKHKTVHFYLL